MFWHLCCYIYTDIMVQMLLFLYCDRCCGADGLILKPSRPALVIDAQLIQVGSHAEEMLIWS